MTWVTCGDALEVLAAMPPMSVDLVATDSPFSINTKSDGLGKLSPWADTLNAAHWYTLWIAACRRVLKPTGAMWTCLNWRSQTVFYKASCDLGWSIESMLVWDKSWIGPGGNRGLRPSYEQVALWAMPDFGLQDRGLSDLQQFPWASHKPNGHPAEKPVTLFRWIIKHSLPKGGHVHDPFVGSGTTGEAALSLQCTFSGSEVDPYWADFANTRIRQAGQQVPLFAGVAR